MESNSHRYLGHNQNRDDNHQKPNERRQQNWVVHDIRNSAQKKKQTKIGFERELTSIEWFLYVIIHNRR